MNALVIPLLGMVMIMQIRSMQPKSAELFSGNATLGIVAGAVTGVVIAIAKAPIWAVIASAAIAGTLAYSLDVFIQKRVADEEEASLASFMRNITEYRKSGYTLPRAIEKLSKEGMYDESFRNELKGISAKLNLGFRLSDMQIGKSWIGRQLFFLLGQIEDTGGGKVREFETVYRFIERYTFAKKKTKSTMKVYQMLTVFTPIGLAILIFMMSAMFTYLKMPSFGIGSSLTSSPLSSYTSIPPQLFTAADVMVVLAAIFMSLSSSIAMDFTIKNMWRVALVLILASATLFGISLIGPELAKHLFSIVPSGGLLSLI